MPLRRDSPPTSPERQIVNHIDTPIATTVKQLPADRLPPEVTLTQLYLRVFENAANELRVRISSAIAASGENGDPMAALRAAISTMFDHAGPV
ncbi:hypothetical protein [Nocardia vulneris]|uniref:Uncharacterized protein n=1 Tax=Nocardia vulneris TaxID=1141657 RepID=A0ABR4ZKG4_9NOCA|nr:hypothetical protein [Nocardia vulneris]KIA65580.1 hypothetical protein FG87_08215 [Nocardia vulneris]